MDYFLNMQQKSYNNKRAYSFVLWQKMFAENKKPKLTDTNLKCVLCIGIHSTTNCDSLSRIL